MTKWQEVNLPLGPFYDEAQKSFVEHVSDLKSGMLLDFGSKQVLVGDVNVALGRCDCCSTLERDDVVKRFKVLDLE